MISQMRPFLVTIHDATPRYAREMEFMLRELAPLVGRRVSLGVVPNWHGVWPLDKHPEFCRLVQHGADELLLHGYFHKRREGFGPVSLLAERSDELNGLSTSKTLELIENGQRDFVCAFGNPARGFLPPAWQQGRLRHSNPRELRLQHILSFFSLSSVDGRRIPLATYTWDCGRYSALGHVGDALGRILRLQNGRVPTLAIHPRDIERGYWPRILRLTQELLQLGFEPQTCSGLFAEVPELNTSSENEPTGLGAHTGKQLHNAIDAEVTI